MEYFEYKVIPAPRRSIRVKGAKGTDGKFAATLEKTINDLAAEGWQYLRAESLPIDERHGITRRKTENYQNVLVFSRPTDKPAIQDPVEALQEDEDSDDTVQDDPGEDTPEDDDDKAVADTEEDDAQDDPEDDTAKEDKKS